MNTLLEIIHITLVAVAKSVFNFAFLFILAVIYLMIKKYKLVNIYSFDYSKSLLVSFIESLLQGVFIGILGSLIITCLGLPIKLTDYIIFLLPLALMLALINVRYLCIAYASTIMGALALIFKGQKMFGLTLPIVDIQVTGLMALVGIFHLMECILIYFVGADELIPVVAKKKDKIVVGYLMQRFWPIPIALLVLTSGTAGHDAIQMPQWWPLLKEIPKEIAAVFSLLPLVGALGYSSLTFSEEPIKRSKKTAFMLFSYSVLLILLSILSVNHTVLQWIGVIIMGGMHEGIILYEDYIERLKKPIYDLPAQGVRVMSICPEGPGDKMGLKIGDIIAKVNGMDIENTRALRTILHNKFTFIWLDVIGIDGSAKILEYKAYPSGVDDLRIKPLPENPRIIYSHHSMRRVGLIHIIRSKWRSRRKG